jgi:hypothetical protein
METRSKFNLKPAEAADKDIKTITTSSLSLFDTPNSRNETSNKNALNDNSTSTSTHHWAGSLPTATLPQKTYLPLKLHKNKKTIRDEDSGLYAFAEGNSDSDEETPYSDAPPLVIRGDRAMFLKSSKHKNDRSTIREVNGDSVIYSFVKYNR